MKELISTIRELWKDPKGHAIIVLGFYAIFFGTIFLYLFVASKTRDNEYTHMTALQKLNQMNDYNYQLEINDEIIEGHFLDDINTFVYENQEYVYRENLKPEFKYQEMMEYANTKTIYNLIKDAEIYSKTEYNDSSISKVYQLENIEITTYELNNNIYQIEIKTSETLFRIMFMLTS